MCLEPLLDVGPPVGAILGKALGLVVGPAVGGVLGFIEGLSVGPALGDVLGEVVGPRVGPPLGETLGISKSRNVLSGSAVVGKRLDPKNCMS